MFEEQLIKVVKVRQTRFDQEERWDTRLEEEERWDSRLEEEERWATRLDEEERWNSCLDEGERWDTRLDKEERWIHALTMGSGEAYAWTRKTIVSKKRIIALVDPLMLPLWLMKLLIEFWLL